MLKRQVQTELGNEPRLQERLERVDNDVARLSKLVAELLDFSRISARRLVLYPEPLDLAALVQEVCAASPPTANGWAPG